MTQQVTLHNLEFMGTVQKQENGISYELKPRNVERWLCTCDMLLADKLKLFLYIILTSFEMGSLLKFKKVEIIGIT